MSDTITVNASITYPTENINAFADDLGYPTIVSNPSYAPAQGAPTINDPDHTPPEGYDPAAYEWPQVPNPDYVAAVGEPTMSNPESRVDFVKRHFRAMATNWFTQFAERNITRQKQAEATAEIAQVKAGVEAAITI